MTPMLLGAVSVAAFLWIQDPALLVDLTGETRAPTPVSCGLLDLPLPANAPWRAVTLGGDGISVAGVVVRRPFGTAVRAVLPAGLPRGRISLKIGRARAAPRLPQSALVFSGGEAAYESEGFMARFDARGGIEIGGCVCALHPPAARAGVWIGRENDPVRSVLAFEGAPGSTAALRPPLVLYASVCAGAPEVDLTLVVTGTGAGLPEALGLSFGPAGVPDPPGEGAEPAAGGPSSESRPEEPAPPSFEEVFDDLRASMSRSADVSCSVVAVVRRHGPLAPVASPGRAGQERVLLAVGPEESLGAGETRVLRVRLCAGAERPDILLRPGTFPETLPGRGRTRPTALCRDLRQARRKLDAAIGAFRSDPRHGLLHERGDLGDWKMDPFRFGNLEWDTSFGFMLRFLEAGDRVDGFQAIAGVEHLLLHDRDPASGLFFQHGGGHQSGLIEAGHHWAEGVATVASWLDDPWLVDASRSLARDQVAAFSKLDLESALPRSVGWALIALCALHEIGAEREASLALVRKLVRFVVGRQSESGHFLMERSTAQDGAFRVSPFVDGGILVPALERAAKVTRDPIASDASRRARAALLRDAVILDAEGPTLASSVLVDPRSGRVLSRAGAAEGEEILLFLSGVGSGGGPVETALLRRAEESLALDSRVFLGKGISMLMRALPAYAARARGR